MAYLWQGGAELALQRVSVVDDVLKMLLGQAEALLGLPQSVQQPVPLVQHVDHQLLKVGVWVRGAALRAALAQRRVLADGGHHLAHHLAAAGEEGDQRLDRVLKRDENSVAVLPVNGTVEFNNVCSVLYNKRH